MEKKLDIRRLSIFLLFAFGIAWLTAWFIARSGGIVNSPMLVPGLRLRLAVVLIAVLYMSAPALANVFTRVTTREGWANTWLRPHLIHSWRSWLAVWMLVVLFIFLGTIAYYLVFPDQFDPQLTLLRQSVSSAGTTIDPWLLVGLQALQGIILSAFINAPFTFGEEFGWRGYLLQKLLPLGPRRAILISGIIIGIWHWPVTAMGHNYGLNYPGFPMTGMLAMVWFTLVFGVLLSWAVLRAGSVWPAVIGHAVMNGLGVIGSLVSNGNTNPLLGPSPAGLIGSVAFTVFAVWVMLKPDTLSHTIPATTKID